MGYVAALAVGQEAGVRGDVGDDGVDWRAGVGEGTVCGEGLEWFFGGEGVWEESAAVSVKVMDLEAVGGLEGGTQGPGRCHSGIVS